LYISYVNRGKLLKKLERNEYEQKYYASISRKNDVPASGTDTDGADVGAAGLDSKAPSVATPSVVMR
jgi:hypothetical protein